MTRTGKKKGKKLTVVVTVVVVVVVVVTTSVMVIMGRSIKVIVTGLTDSSSVSLFCLLSGN